MVWRIILLALIMCCSLVLTKTYEKFWCTTQEGPQQLTCPDDDALLTDVIVKKVYRRTKRCEPDVHTEYLIHCQNNINATQCEGNHSCTIDISSTDYVLCKDGERQAPTYFFVKYTCMQIYTLCQHKETVRNTLYGFIVSPAYPYPMADNLKCSISIEAEHSMHIELAPLQLQLHDSIKCHTEYLEIFGYGGNSNDSLTNNNNHYQNGKNGAIWKWYHTWCGDERSSNHPLSSARYIIPSNSVYMSLQTTLSSKSRHFKIRYKVVPSTSRNYDHVILPSSTTPILSLASITTTVFGIVEEFANKNQTITKKSHKKEIIIGVIAGIGTLVVAIAIGIVLLIFFKRRQSSVKTSSSSASKNVTASKKPLSAATTKNNTNQKHVPTPSDKTPMLDSSPTSGAQAQKRKLVPERTVQISDLNSSRFKPTTTPVGGNAATTTTSSHQLKEVSSTGSEAAGTAIMTSAVPPSLKPIVSVDSGVYGAELTDQQATVDKIKEAKIYGIDLPDKVETLTKTISINPSLEQPSSPIHITQEVNDNSDDLVQIVVNPLSELENLTNTAVTISDKIDTEITPLLPVENPETLDNTRASSPLTPPTLLSNDISHTPPPSVFDVNSRRQSQLEPLSSPHNKGDTTVTSAYPTLIDATASENEGDNRQIVEKHVENSVIYNQPKKTTFNPLHVILKKDANKYYTTEYI